MLLYCEDPLKAVDTSHPADLFFPTPTGLLYRTFTHAGNTAWRVFIHIFPSLSTARYSFMSERGRCGENENVQSSKQQLTGFEARLSRIRVRHSTAELPRSTNDR